MSWTVVALVVVAGAVAGVIVWRRFVEPLRVAEDLLRSLGDGRVPETFLMTGNGRGRRIGLLAEKLGLRMKKLEERLHERESSVEAAFGAMPDGLVVVDERRRIRMSNPQFSRIFGLQGSASELTLLEAIGHASIDRLVTDTITSGESQRESIQMSRGPSEGREMEVSVVPLAGNSPGAVALFRDVTQFRRMEEMRRDFVANISHELRTPLSIFRGYLETLLDDPQQPPGELLRILEVMERHSDRLNALVEDVLSLARLESPDIELAIDELNVPEFLRSVAADWAPRLKQKQLQSKIVIAPDLPVLWADEARLQEVVYNLLDNAVKYSRPDGTITLEAGLSGEHIRVSVADQGAGIPPSDVPRIFERFYRADKARSRDLGGTGLGLSIVKHIAQLHGGAVEAESLLGRGTTISVLLPTEGPSNQEQWPVG